MDTPEIQIEKISIREDYLYITAKHFNTVQTAPATLEDPPEYGDLLMTAKIPIAHLQEFLNLDSLLWYLDT